tara:strand:+ start:1513 stop:2259 length:747 start_codon:yes stop_codon:yes gene_type:complete
MVIKNKIKEIHNKLSLSKIDSFDSIITAESFSSVLKDRFISELNSLSLDWDLEPTTINKLTNKKKISKYKQVEKLIQNKNKTSKSNIGIDIQKIDKLPVVKDPWESDFYKKNFRKNEIAHCLKKKNPYQSFAGIYSIKEAIFKIDGSSKANVEITFDNDGKPESSGYSISISHDEGYAIGVALKNIENKDELNIKEIKSKLDVIDKKIEEVEKNIYLQKKERKKYIKSVFILIPLLIIIYMLFKYVFK